MIPSDLKQKALSMRAVGASYASIHSRTGISVSTLQQLFRSERLAKGNITSELLKQAKSDLLSDTAITSMIKSEMKHLISTEINIANAIFDDVSLSLEQLSTQTPLNKARALASLASAFSTASQVARRALTVSDEDTTTLPSLSIMRLTDSEIAIIKKGVAMSDLDL